MSTFGYTVVQSVSSNAGYEPSAKTRQGTQERPESESMYNLRGDIDLNRCYGVSERPERPDRWGLTLDRPIAMGLMQ